MNTPHPAFLPEPAPSGSGFLKLWLAGAPLWGAAMAFSALSGLYLRLRLETGHLPLVLALFFAGGLLGWAVALPLMRPFMRRWSAERRFAAALLVLTCLTIVATAGLFALQYRIFYAQWHAAFGSRIWVYQFVFTTAGAVYQFLVMGLRLYLPVGLLLLIGASLLLARRMR